LFHFQNGQELKLMKFLGVFPWHQHDLEDEVFLVWSGKILIQLRDGRVALDPGEFSRRPPGSRTSHGGGDASRSADFRARPHAQYRECCRQNVHRPERRHCVTRMKWMAQLGTEEDVSLHWKSFVPLSLRALLPPFLFIRILGQ
jgi:hypothetical protein